MFDLNQYRKKKGKGKRNLLYLIIYVFVGFYCAVTVFPFYVMAVGTFKTQAEILSQPFSIPGKPEVKESIRYSFIRDELPVNEEKFKRRFNLPEFIPFNKKIKDFARDQKQLNEMKDYLAPFIRFGNILMAIQKGNFLRNYLITILLIATSLVFILLLGSMAAYPLSNLWLKISMALYPLFLLGLALPYVLGLLPVYILINKLGLKDNIFSLVFLYTGTQMPITIFIFSVFYKTIPKELQDAAEVDGVNKFGYYFRILLPMSKTPALTVAIIVGTFIFNDYLNPLIFLSNPDWTTVQVGLSMFVGTKTWFYGPIFAGIAVAIIPMILFYLLINKVFIKGLTSGVFR